MVRPMAEYPYGVSDQHIAVYRAKAEECRQRADDSLTPADKSAWLLLADDWTQMAWKVERVMRQGGP